MVSKEKYLERVKRGKVYQWADNDEDRQEILEKAEKVWEKNYAKEKENKRFEKKLNSLKVRRQLKKGNIDEIDI